MRSLQELDWRGVPDGQLERWGRMSLAAAARHVTLLRQAGRVARTIPSRRPCDYGPWIEAFDLVTRRKGLHVLVEPERASLALLSTRLRRTPEGKVAELLRFLKDAARGGGWPPEHAHLVDFALTFLEEDPMWFRSGYAKKALARRLGQVSLSEAEIARLLPVMQRVVIEGTGLEEFKPLCRLAQRTRPPGLWAWLELQRNHPDVRVRRNARYMREAGWPWWQMHRLVQRISGLGAP
ncbi:MAG: hypothetical protein M3O00_04915 [Pseudomonadota bacterium]|nr:hypothetical protein [Pseudomonadota bacterium]